MAKAAVDFSDVQEFEAIPKGEYDAVVTKVEFRSTDTTGKEYDYLNWEFDLVDGEFKGRKQWLVTSFSPKALWRMKEVFENLGVYEEEIEIDYDEETMLVTDPELAGLPCSIVVSQRPYEGRMTNQVDAVLGPDGGAPAKKKAPAGRKPAGRKPAAEKKTTGGRRFK